MKISNGVKKLFAIIGVVALLGMTLFGTLNFLLSRPANTEPLSNNDTEKYNLPLSEETEHNDIGLILPEELSKEEEGINFVLKPEVKIDVPFYVQSPFAKWDNLHNEACEETSLIMVESWVKDEALNQEELNQRILDSVAWQEENWNGHFDLNVQKVVELANQYFGIKRIYYTSLNSINDVKKELSKGNLVIVPAAGRLLGNPHYRSPGPAYHMLVVVGYNKKEIITNDSGTRKGESFSYPNDIFFNAIHDWPFSLKEFKYLSKDEKAEEVKLQGKKMMIIVEKH
ncbi:C39 family peptidase [bacterium]|nr:C39 family peptidase [bacterium]